MIRIGTSSFYATRVEAMLKFENVVWDTFYEILDFITGFLVFTVPTLMSWDNKVTGVGS